MPISRPTSCATSGQDDPLVIVEHSFGSWNGAHLSSTPTKTGYKVELLVTLDPVGKGAMVSSTSDTYDDTPKPTAKYWINIRAKPKDGNFSDMIGDLGEQWEIKGGPQMNYVADVNHRTQESCSRVR